ncbi:MAG: hypothetical protein H6813_03335 [Phycisphaeraceae bacterium]|nr:hypothetical protein [Phycisphaeraceae bacterium]MCB9846979.1 hypothetical protein [Phycisphaeraceae bacterium]
MPRLSRLRIGALADLAGQLRFAPKKRILAQLESAMKLAGEIDPEIAYPEDWVVFRITGYRPEMDSPTLIIGQALRGDLSAFAERVSDRARLRESDMPPFLRPDELAARWRVSVKTLERARRRGLIALRRHDADGVVRLAYPLNSVERYEREHRGDLDAAGAFGRIDPEAADRLALVGDRAMRRFGWSLNETAQRLAERTGRGRETMRQLLQRRAGIRGAGALPAHDRRVIDRAARRAVRVSVIAKKYDRTDAAVRLIINQSRLRRMLHWRLPDRVAMDDRELSLLLEHPLLAGPPRTAAPMTIAGFIEITDRSGKPDADRERLLATAHRALLCRAGAVGKAMQRSSPRAGALDDAEADLRLASILRAALVASELGLIRGAIEGRLGAPVPELRPAVATLAYDAAVVGCIEAAASFDPARGGRLAASASLAINRALADAERAIAKQATRSAPAGLRDWTRAVAPWQRWLDLPRAYEALLPSLEPPGGPALALLHALTGRRPLPPREIASELGLPRVAVARAIGDGVRALRALHRAGGSGEAQLR